MTTNNNDNNIKFEYSFDEAISRLSIAGYYLEGHSEDFEKQRNSYDIRRRTENNRTVASIYRNGTLELISEKYKSYKLDRESIMKAMTTKYFLPGQRSERIEGKRVREKKKPSPYGALY